MSCKKGCRGKRGHCGPQGPVGPTGATGPALVTEVGMIGFNFNSSQVIPSSAPTTVEFNADLGTAFGIHPSFNTDTSVFGFVILEDGIYQINYDLFMTTTDLTSGGNQVTYTSNVTYPSSTGIQNIAFSQTYGPAGLIDTNGIILNGNIIVALTTSNSPVTLIVQHNSNSPEQVIGPITGPFVGAPDTYYSYMQILKIG